ncbi:MAG: phosphonate C-P lyase system protein PhnG [Paracoccaceae bacterium]
MLDALLQGSRSTEVDSKVITPLRELRLGRKDVKAKKAAATKVDFFTLARGEDE